MTRPQARLLLLLVAFLAAWGWPVTKIGLDYFEPLAFMGMRFLAVGLLLIPFAIRRFDWRAFRASCLIGVVMLISTVLWVLAVARSSELGLAGFVIAAGMVLSPLYSQWFFGERVGTGFKRRLALALGGGALMAPDFHLDNFLLFAGAAVAFGWQITLINHQARGADTVTVGFGQMLTTGAGLLAVSLVVEPVAQFSDATLDGWLWLGLAGVALTGARFLLQIKAQRGLNHQDSSFILNLESVFVLAVTAVIFGETHTWVALVGAALVFAAAMLSATEKAPDTKKPA